MFCQFSGMSFNFLPRNKAFRKGLFNHWFPYWGGWLSSHKNVATPEVLLCPVRATPWILLFPRDNQPNEKKREFVGPKKNMADIEPPPPSRNIIQFSEYHPAQGDREQLYATPEPKAFGKGGVSRGPPCGNHRVIKDSLLEI